MKKSSIVLLAALLILCLYSCGTSGIKSSSYSDTYLPEQDFNPTAQSWRSRDINMVSTKEGLYFIAGTYLFFYDYETRKTSPLCFKPDCLHNLETDTSKTTECNAFVGEAVKRSFIGIYNDKLYLNAVNPENGHDDLIEMSKDGSSRKCVLENLGASDVKRILLHRGVLYYVTTTYSTEGIQTSSINALSLLSANSKSEVIYQAEDKHSISSVFPCRNQLFFIDGVEKTQENGDITIEQKILSYQLKNQSIKEIMGEGIHSICGVKNDAVIILSSRKYYEYSLSDEILKPSEGGIALFTSEHEGWTCQAECIEDDFNLFSCFDREEANDFIYDSYVTDGQGSLTCIINNSSWSNFNSQMIEIKDEEYLVSYSRSLEPFSVNLYKKTDLLNGVSEPLTILKADSFNLDLNKAYITPR